MLRCSSSFQHLLTINQIDDNWCNVLVGIKANHRGHSHLKLVLWSYTKTREKGVNLTQNPSRHGKQNRRKNWEDFKIHPCLGGQTDKSSWTGKRGTFILSYLSYTLLYSRLYCYNLRHGFSFLYFFVNYAAAKTFIHTFTEVSISHKYDYLPGFSQIKGW